MTALDRRVVDVLKGHGRRMRSGSPWVFSNEINMNPDCRRIPPGEVVILRDDRGEKAGAFIFNPHSLMAARLMDHDPEAAIDQAWVARRVGSAAALRARLIEEPYYRLIHAEADGMPGLVVDRYGDVAVLQANSAGMDRLLPQIAAALMDALPIRAIVARNDSAARGFEALPSQVGMLVGSAPEAEVIEGGVHFAIDPLGGQKTGWFYDQRGNRDMIARLARGARVLDVCCHTGAFGLRCAAAGAAAVTLLDSSQPALDRAREAARLNGLKGVAFLRGDAFELLEQMEDIYDVVICDPPAFAKSKKDAEAGLRAYGRLARLAGRRVAPGGLLFTASCSHHAPMDKWAGQIAHGLARASRDGRILAATGAGPDHPVHPHLPESAYLKAQLIQLD